MLLLLPLLLVSASLFTAPLSQGGGPAVTVPTFANSTCPIMGKKVSLPLFADTEYGRIYVCCKPCIRKILVDVAAAYATAYPATKDIANAVCPVSGEPIGAQRTPIELQGVRFALCCADCVETARRDSQITLARAQAPELVDIGNGTCPVDGQPVQPNAFAVVGGTIVRLSSPAHVAAVTKAPQANLDKARAIRAEEPKAAPHRHAARPDQPAPGKEKS